jgi:sulfate permease, SulP family
LPNILEIDMPDGASTAHLFRPKLVTVFGEGYDLRTFRSDLVAGLTVAIVALPLSMAIAVASGVSPDRGLYAAIVGGLLVSALGGSRVQVGGPAGAFIILVSTTVARFGLDGLLLSVFLSGLVLTIVGLSRLGSLIRLIPQAVTVGFILSIAVTIMMSQIKDLFGLTLPSEEQGSFLARLQLLFAALSTFNPTASLLGVGSASLIFFLRWWRPLWPGMLMAVVLASALAFGFHLPVATIGARFGELPHGLPMPRVPAHSSVLLLNVLPTVLSFTLLGGVESLLSARIADGMTGRKHRSNMELVAQGIANMASALFGGICVTGTIARTATNIRAGAKSPLAGMMHAGFLLAFLLFASPLASFVPLSALAGILVVVAWNMAEWKEVFLLLGNWRGGAVLVSTFLSTLSADLTVGIAIGCLVAVVTGTIARVRRA